MRKKLAYFVASMVMALAATFTFVSPNADAKLDGCRPQCRVGYQKCVKETSNPGGLNQCKKAYEACLSGCN